MLVFAIGSAENSEPKKALRYLKAISARSFILGPGLSLANKFNNFLSQLGLNRGQCIQELNRKMSEQQKGYYSPRFPNRSGATTSHPSPQSRNSPLLERQRKSFSQSETPFSSPHNNPHSFIYPSNVTNNVRSPPTIAAHNNYNPNSELNKSVDSLFDESSDMLTNSSSSAPVICQDYDPFSYESPVQRRRSDDSDRKSGMIHNDQGENRCMTTSPDVDKFESVACSGAISFLSPASTWRTAQTTMSCRNSPITYSQNFNNSSCSSPESSSCSSCGTNSKHVTSLNFVPVIPGTPFSVTPSLKSKSLEVNSVLQNRSYTAVSLRLRKPSVTINNDRSTLMNLTDSKSGLSYSTPFFGRRLESNSSLQISIEPTGDSISCSQTSLLQHEYEPPNYSSSSSCSSALQLCYKSGDTLHSIPSEYCSKGFINYRPTNYGSPNPDISKSASSSQSLFLSRSNQLLPSLPFERSNSCQPLPFSSMPTTSAADNLFIPCSTTLHQLHCLSNLPHASVIQHNERQNQWNYDSSYDPGRE